MTSCDDDAVGRRVYDALAPAEKERLTRPVTDGPSGDAWRRHVEGLVNDAVERRLASGDANAACDPESIIQEVLPSALAAVPDNMRTEMLRSVHGLLRQQ